MWAGAYPPHPPGCRAPMATARCVIHQAGRGGAAEPWHVYAWNPGGAAIYWVKCARIVCIQCVSGTTVPKTPVKSRYRTLYPKYGGILDQTRAQNARPGGVPLPIYP